MPLGSPGQRGEAAAAAVALHSGTAAPPHLGRRSGAPPDGSPFATRSPFCHLVSFSSALQLGPREHQGTRPDRRRGAEAPGLEA